MTLSQVPSDCLSTIKVFHFLLIALVFGGNARAESFNEIVITSNTLPSVLLNIEQKYFSNNLQSLIFRILQKRQKRWVALKVGYPSMEPWKAKSSDINEKEVLAILQGRAVITTEEFWNFELKLKDYEFVGMSEFNINEYKYPETSALSELPTRYFYGSSKECQTATIVTCPDSNADHVKCRSEIVTRRYGLGIGFSFSKSLMGEWCDVSNKVGAFFDERVEKEL